MNFKNYFNKLEGNRESKVPRNNKLTAFVDWIHRNIFKKMTHYRHLLVWYVSVIVIASLLLITPMARATGADPISWIDALFISVSSISDTGLTTVTLSESFNDFGQAIALILIQLGGIGWFAIKVSLLTLIVKKVRHDQIYETRNELATTGKQETVAVVKVAVGVTLGATLLFGILFGILFATTTPIMNITEVSQDTIVDPKLIGNWGQAMWAGFFHAGSSINNAGLDIIAGNTSIAAYYGNITIQILTMFLFITGGIGFIIIYDLLKYFKAKKDSTRFKFSLLTKISFTSYVIIALIGLGTVYTIEGIQAATNPESSFIKSDAGTEAQNWWALTFNTFSTRNAGLSTFNIDTLSQPSQLTFISMMYIGSGPGSTAGGLRTTTVAIIALSVISIIKDKSNVVAFKRTIKKETMRDAFIILSISLFLLMSSTILVSMMEYGKVENQTVLDYLFVVTSAFGTTGLSPIPLEQFHVFSKIVLMFVMLVGQIGVISMIKILSPNRKNKKVVELEYLSENVPLGH